MSVRWIIQGGGGAAAPSQFGWDNDLTSLIDFQSHLTFDEGRSTGILFENEISPAMISITGGGLVIDTAEVYAGLNPVPPWIGIYKMGPAFRGPIELATKMTSSSTATSQSDRICVGYLHYANQSDYDNDISSQPLDKSSGAGTWDYALCGMGGWPTNSRRGIKRNWSDANFATVNNSGWTHWNMLMRDGNDGFGSLSVAGAANSYAGIFSYSALQPMRLHTSGSPLLGYTESIYQPILYIESQGLAGSRLQATIDGLVISGRPL